MNDTNMGFDTRHLNIKEEEKEYAEAEEAHRTEEGYCCACGYDMAVMEEKIQKKEREAENNGILEGMKSVKEGDRHLNRMSEVMERNADLDKVNRVEVIDHTKEGRVYVKREDNIKVTYDLQDNDRTLKIFIEEEV